MLGKKNSVSSASSSDDEDAKEERKQKKLSSTNLKAMFNGSPKDKSPSVASKDNRSRKASSSHVSLHSIDLTGSPVIRSRSSSLQSSDSLRAFTAGILSLRVHCAKKLEKKGMFGKADPYVRVTFGQHKSRSKTISNNQEIFLEIFNILLVNSCLSKNYSIFLYRIFIQILFSES